MDRQFPVYTVEAQCQDCYKCVRSCHCKAIRISGARAAVIPELCVSCGACVKICPAHAKRIRSDLARLKKMLAGGERLYASLAPSYLGYFKGATIRRLAGALLELGFTGVSETAHGAQLVSAETGRFIAESEPGVHISSACPACVDYLRKYHPGWSGRITPFDSPALSHARLLRKVHGDDLRVVFFGPCAAKKNEADAHPGLLDLAITFDSLRQLLEERSISPESCGEAELALGEAEEGRRYSIEGGMNDTLREPGSGITYLAVSGLDNLARVLEALPPRRDRRLFIEALACPGGCINGPVMEKGSSSLEFLLETAGTAPDRTSLGRPVPVDIGRAYPPDRIRETEPDEARLRKALGSIGKHTKADELNCSSCGYDSCRDFARALLAGNAEDAMCHIFLKKNFQRTSNALIKYIPAGVVLVDENLNIIESNRHFAELIDESATTIYDSLGSLAALSLPELVDFADLFESVLANGGEIEKFNQLFRNRILNISVFSISPGKIAGAVIQDVTQSELQREQIAGKAKEVIRKNVLTVQKVARLFGEHIAESEVLLNEIAGSYFGRKEQP